MGVINSGGVKATTDGLSCAGVGVLWGFCAPSTKGFPSKGFDVGDSVVAGELVGVEGELAVFSPPPPNKAHPPISRASVVKQDMKDI